jgi:class 3 adenylate cyclase
MVTPAPEAHEAPERRQLTVMFTDLVGSTDLASALDPEEWHDVLDAYQHRVAAIVSAHGGVIAQFQGDGAVVYFGYPEAQESASRDALMAGLQIVEDMAHLGAEFPAALGVSELQARAGLHTGEVLVAPVTAGGRERLPDVWGQVPNMAARLQAVGAPGQVVISGETATLVSGFFDLEALGTLTLKGIGHPVPAFRVLGRSGARNRLEARPLTVFIPRASAADWLGEQWSHVSDRSGRLVIVSGEPGIGKSRLLLEFSEDLAAQEHLVVTLACSRRGSLSPLQPFGDVMPSVPATPQEAAKWVHAQASAAPLLLVVEDAHWADPSTLEAVELIARAPAPVLVVMSARPEIADNPAQRRRGPHDVGAAGRCCAAGRGGSRRLGAQGRRSPALSRRAGTRGRRRRSRPRADHAHHALGGDHGAPGPCRSGQARGAGSIGDRAFLRPSPPPGGNRVARAGPRCRTSQVARPRAH